MVKVKALRLHLVAEKHRTLQYEEVEVPQPGAEEVEVRHTAIAAHPWDHHIRQGNGSVYLGELLHAPQTLGLSAAGVVTELGSGVINLQIGQRVVYSTLPAFSHREPARNAGWLPVACSTGLKNAPLGSFCETRVLPAECLVSVPSDIDDEVAAAVFLPGLAAYVLVKKLSHIKPGQTALVHDVTSGGGLGAILCQWLRFLGASVIGTVRCAEDIPRAQSYGCGETVVLPSAKKRQQPLVVAVPERLYTDDHKLQQGLTLVETERETIKVGKLDGEASSMEETVVVEEVMAATQGQGVDVLFALEDCNIAESVCPSQRIVKLDGSVVDHITSRSELSEGSTEVFNLVRRGVLHVPIAWTHELRAGREAIKDLAEVGILVPPVPDPASVPSGS